MQWVVRCLKGFGSHLVVLKRCDDKDGGCVGLVDLFKLGNKGLKRAPRKAKDRES